MCKYNSFFNFLKKMPLRAKKILSLQPQWEFSSVGSEHLPYKQGVAGSNPTIPTKKVETFHGASLRFFL